MSSVTLENSVLQKCNISLLRVTVNVKVLLSQVLIAFTIEELRHFSNHKVKINRDLLTFSKVLGRSPIKDALLKELEYAFIPINPLLNEVKSPLLPEVEHNFMILSNHVAGNC